MAIKYVFKKGTTQEQQENFLGWHTTNIERDVYVKSIKKLSKNVYLVTFGTDSMTSKKLEKSLLTIPLEELRRRVLKSVTQRKLCNEEQKNVRSHCRAGCPQQA